MQYHGGVKMQSMDQEFYIMIDEICAQDNRYHPASYEFVMEAVGFAQKKFKKSRHITGVELLDGIKAVTLKKFGPMSLVVLKHWGIGSTEDFGNIVFNLVEHKVLAKDANDSYDTFKNAHDFEEVFSKGYRQQLAKRLKLMRF